MSVRIAVVDYGRGNLHSIVKALDCAGARAKLITEDDRSEFDLLVIPGVGAFAAAMRELRNRGLDKFVYRFAESGRRVLGICLGCQMLMSNSEEFEGEQGLGLIAGEVVLIPPSSEPVPHVGWKKLQNVNLRGAQREDPFPSIKNGVWTYFVHSFHCVPQDTANLRATVTHGDKDLTAIVGRDNIFGFQFHPEKSGPAGLEILRDFLKLE